MWSPNFPILFFAQNNLGLDKGTVCPEFFRVEGHLLFTDDQVYHNDGGGDHLSMAGRIIA